MTDPIEHPDAVERPEVRHLRRTVEGASHLGPEDQVNMPAGVLTAILSQLDKLETENERAVDAQKNLAATIHELMDAKAVADDRLVAAQASNASLVGALRPLSNIESFRIVHGSPGPLYSAGYAAAGQWVVGIVSEALATLLPESGEAAADNNPETAIPDFLKRQTGEWPPLVFPERRDDEGREGRREGAEEDPSDNNRKGAETDATARTASEIVALVRKGRIDPRPAAEALGLPFDQDIIMAILERAALSPAPLQGDVAGLKAAEDYIKAHARVFAQHGQLRPDQPDADVLIAEQMRHNTAALAVPPSPSKADVGALVEVPLEPTDEMMNAGIDASPMWAVANDFRRTDKVALSKLPLREGNSLNTAECADIYRAMVASFTASHDGDRNVR